MGTKRRQSSDTFRTKPCRVPARRNRTPVARMAQTDAPSRAVLITGLRGSKEKLYRREDINGMLAGTDFTQASPRSVQRWDKKEPNLPERMITTGQMRREDFPERLRAFLKLDK